MPIPLRMGWSSHASRAPSATDAGYRPYEGDSRGGLGGALALTTVVATAALALGGSPARVALALAAGAAVYGPAQAWNELRRLREGLSAARTGPLPLIDRPTEEPARPWHRSPRDIAWAVLAVAVLAASVAEVAFSSDRWLPILAGMGAGLASGDAIVLGWLRRRRAEDGLQVYVRDVEGDEEDADPPRLHLVPRGW